MSSFYFMAILYLFRKEVKLKDKLRLQFEKNKEN